MARQCSVFLQAAPILVFALFVSSSMSLRAQEVKEEAETDAAEAEPKAQFGALEEIVVTARRREESLQEVPDAVTAFSVNRIENFGIETNADFLALVPNLTFRDSHAYRKGDSRLSLRGIGNGQQGWPAVTYVVDGVPVTSPDSFFSGSLIDIERIEVLRGPQSALYGAGAIAGAINIVTRKPSDQFEFKVKAGYGKGDDRRLGAMISGPLVEDKLFYRIVSSRRDWDGLIDSASNGIDLDFEDSTNSVFELLFIPNNDLEFLFKVSYLKASNGSTYQGKIPDPSYIEVFNDLTAPRRRVAGVENREMIDASFKAEWDFPWATLVSVVGYSDLDQDILSGVCYDDPNDPIIDTDAAAPGVQIGCLFNAPAMGDAAEAGEPIDTFFDSLDQYRSLTHDTRLMSTGDTRLRWLFGAQFMQRDAFNGFDAGTIIAPDHTSLTLFPRWDERDDFWWGVYTQFQYDLSQKIELSVAARYDETKHENTQYAGSDRSNIIQVPDIDGTLIDTQEISDDALQPKAQVSYKWDDDINFYLTWSKGFRAGFFNSGVFTLSEETDNIEGGVKSMWFDSQLLLNMAVFRIGYSDQQFSTIIPTPPFRVPVTIPETDIFGAEVESTLHVNDLLTLSGSFGYLYSERADGMRSPHTPEWTFDILGEFIYPEIYSNWNLRINATYDYTTSMYLAQNEIHEIGDKDFLKLRIGIENEKWRLTLWGRNLLDTRMATSQISPLAGGFARIMNRPRSYGVEVQYTY